MEGFKMLFPCILAIIGIIMILIGSNWLVTIGLLTFICGYNIDVILNVKEMIRRNIV